MFRTIKLIISIFLLGAVICGCANKTKQLAITALTEARTAISSANNDTNVKKTKMSLKSSESLLLKADELFSKKDYEKARIFAEKASEEAKKIAEKASVEAKTILEKTKTPKISEKGKVNKKIKSK